eukprot:gene30144-35120_t
MQVVPCSWQGAASGWTSAQNLFRASPPSAAESRGSNIAADRARPNCTAGHTIFLIATPTPEFVGFRVREGSKGTTGTATPRLSPPRLISWLTQQSSEIGPMPGPLLGSALPAGSRGTMHLLMCTAKQFAGSFCRPSSVLQFQFFQTQESSSFQLQLQLHPSIMSQAAAPLPNVPSYLPKPLVLLARNLGTMPLSMCIANPSAGSFCCPSSVLQLQRHHSTLPQASTPLTNLPSDLPKGLVIRSATSAKSTRPQLQRHHSTMLQATLPLTNLPSDLPKDLVIRSATSAESTRPQLQRHHSTMPQAAAPLLHLPSDLPKPKDFIIKSATFVKSSLRLDQFPDPCGPEFAFIGHSNVGKSALINLLTGNPELAKVSKRPGKTRTINHFIINRTWMLVDCPGYGEAKASKTDRMVWHDLTKAYFAKHRTLAHIFLLVDASQTPQLIDVDAAQWFIDKKSPWSLVFTKMDLPGPGVLLPQDNVAFFLSTLRQQTGHEPFYVATSSKSGLGREPLLKYISSLRQSFPMPLVFKK